MPFELGARVRTRAQVLEGHTRLPKYLERRDGCIVRSLGAYPFADERARNASTSRKEALYTVEFSEGAHTVRADLFEPYLEAMG
jgi:hypothetical protein